MNIEDISLDAEQLKILDRELLRYTEINNAYKPLKKQLKYNPPADRDEKEKLMLEVRSLKEQKNNTYVLIGNTVKRMVCDNPEYQTLVTKYFDYCSYTEDVARFHKNNLHIIHNKKKMDTFFDALKYDMENNVELSDKKKETYREMWRNIISVLSEKFNEINGVDKDVGDYYFSGELNLSDTYNVLSIISFLYSNIINPVYHNNYETYIDYNQKMRYIKRFDEKITTLTRDLVKAYAD